MKVAVQQEDLQLLGKTLQEQLLAEVPFAGAFQVQCAVNKDGLMILTQHSSDTVVDCEKIFAVLEEVFYSLSPQKEQQIQCFLRVIGEKLPYAKRFLIVKSRDRVREWESGRAEVEGDVDVPKAVYQEVGDEEEITSSYTSSSIIYSPIIDETEKEELFDPFIEASNFSELKPARQAIPIFFGLAALLGIVIFGSSTYLLTRPCVMSECKETQVAKQLKTQYPQLVNRAQSEKELVAVQQQLETASTALNIIPIWSPHHKISEELKANLSVRSEKINQVVKALQTASLAAQKMQTSANSLEELQARQHLWRQAIAPLEAVTSNSELYRLVQEKLFSYRVSLHAVNQQILTQEKWLKKLTSIKLVASNATKRESLAKSLNDWQKVQSTWQVAINTLNMIPLNSPGYQEAQKLLVEYKPKLIAARDRATKEQLATKTYQQALLSANQAKIYEQQNQWQAAATYWNQALQTTKQIPRDSYYYNQGQTLIAPYSTALTQAQEKIQIASNFQQTRTDLNKTCVNAGIRICTFSIENQGIIVKLTPDYDQVIQNSSANTTFSENPNTSVITTNHLQILREALSIISDNANLPLFLYNSQSQVIYTRTLE